MKTRINYEIDLASYPLSIVLIFIAIYSNSLKISQIEISQSFLFNNAFRIIYLYCRVIENYCKLSHIKIMQHKLKIEFKSS